MTSGLFPKSFKTPVPDSFKNKIGVILFQSVHRCLAADTVWDEILKDLVYTPKFFESIVIQDLFISGQFLGYSINQNIGSSDQHIKHNLLVGRIVMKILDFYQDDFCEFVKLPDMSDVKINELIKEALDEFKQRGLFYDEETQLVETEETLDVLVCRCFLNWKGRPGKNFPKCRYCNGKLIARRTGRTVGGQYLCDTTLIRLMAGNKNRVCKSRKCKELKLHDFDPNRSHEFMKFLPLDALVETPCEAVDEPLVETPYEAVDEMPCVAVVETPVKAKVQSVFWNVLLCVVFLLAVFIVVWITITDNLTLSRTRLTSDIMEEIL